jgi:hypothetical protein
MRVEGMGGVEFGASSPGSRSGSGNETEMDRTATGW